MMKLKTQRNDKERQEEEVTEEPVRFLMQEAETGREFSLFEEALLGFWALGLEHRTVHISCSS